MGFWLSCWWRRDFLGSDALYKTIDDFYRRIHPFSKDIGHLFRSGSARQRFLGEFDSLLLIGIKRYRLKLSFGFCVCSVSTCCGDLCGGAASVQRPSAQRIGSRVERFGGTLDLRRIRRAPGRKPGRYGPGR